MKAMLITAMILWVAPGSVVAQKKSTLMGDIVIGQLTGMNAATREITIKYPGKQGPEIFTGTLADSYKLKTGDNIPQDLKLSEVTPGMQLRLFYKTEKEINRIVRVDILGKDEYFRLRNQLTLDPSTQIARAEKDDLPAISPLKIFLAISYDHTHQQLAAWIDKWNQKNGDSVGKLESVSDLDQADILIVVTKGADTLVAALPMLDGDGKVDGVWTQATSYVVVKDAGRLKVLWEGVAPVFSGPKAEVSLKTTELVVAEIEKRMKARAGKSKK
jgi:hypothetical protein